MNIIIFKNLKDILIIYKIFSLLEDTWIIIFISNWIFYIYDIKLKGNNLLDFEFDIAKNIKGKKVINKFLYANEITKNLNFTKNNFNKNKS